MKGWNLILLAIWLIATGLAVLLKFEFSGMVTIFAIVQIAAGVLLLLAGKKDQLFSKIAGIFLAIWLIADGLGKIIKFDFSGKEIVLGILAIVAAVLIVIGMKKGEWSKHLGGLLLAIWLIFTGLIPAIVTVNFSAMPIIMAILVIASGILLLLKR